MNAGQLCVRDVVIVEAQDTLVEAARRMLEHHVGCLVVARRSPAGCVPIGMLTDRDIAICGVARHPEGLARLRVEAAMSGDLLTAGEDEDLYDVIKQMRSRAVRRVVVVDAREQLVGLLAYDDLLEWLSEQLSDLIRLLGRARELEAGKR